MTEREPWMPNDEAIDKVSADAIKAHPPTDGDWVECDRACDRAVARLAVESYQRWAVEQGGVDVEALATAARAEQCLVESHHFIDGGPGRHLAMSKCVADALRTAIAQQAAAQSGKPSGAQIDAERARLGPLDVSQAGRLSSAGRPTTQMLLARIAELEREVERLRADAERLDWLAALTSRCKTVDPSDRYSMPVESGGRWYIYNDDEERDVEADSLRAAIDAAKGKP